MKKLFFLLSMMLITLSSLAQVDPISIGSSPNDGTGDNLREAFEKVNTNDAYLDTMGVQRLDSLLDAGVGGDFWPLSGSATLSANTNIAAGERQFMLSGVGNSLLNFNVSEARLLIANNFGNGLTDGHAGVELSRNLFSTYDFTLNYYGLFAEVQNGTANHYIRLGAYDFDAGAWNRPTLRIYQPGDGSHDWAIYIDNLPTTDPCATLGSNALWKDTTTGNLKICP